MIGAGFHDFQSIQAELVECMALWMRSPGMGGGSFAKDAPWHLMMRDAASDYDARGGDMEAARVRPLPLSAREVARRDEVSEWLLAIPSPENRRLVVMVVTHLARGARQIPWSKLRKPMGLTRGTGGLRQRYATAIHAICVMVNAKSAQT